MSSRPGRNDPCTCGSGKKYKRCCLAKDEIAQAAQAVARYDDVEDHLVEGDELDDADADGWLPLDVDTIARVSYTTGFIDSLSDLRPARGLRIVEWTAPHIPDEVLDSLECQDLVLLEGRWGAAKAGTPIEVHLIDIETDDDLISIELFNRTLVVADIAEDDDEAEDDLWNIHQLCASLDAAAGLTEAAVPSQPMPSRPALEAPSALEADQPGACELCGTILPAAEMPGHLATCAPANDVPADAAHRLLRVRVTSGDSPLFWLELEAKATARLDQIDRCLRQVWLECCDHLSVFRIGEISYFSRRYDFDGLGLQGDDERMMTVRLGDVLPPAGTLFAYEYDVGSTTELQLTVVGERTGRIGRGAVRLLARNTAPEWQCGACGEPAAFVCAECRDIEANPFVCARHRRRHTCGARDAYLPVANSPRVGVCGYGAEPL
jgi:SEC-C motif